jgi:hypothetical protein
MFFTSLALPMPMVKRTILMNHVGGFGESTVPFDSALQQRLEYRTLDANLLDRLKNAITSLPRN